MGNSAVRKLLFRGREAVTELVGFSKMWKVNISLEGFLPRDTNGALH
jgi:hypothetical protein